MGKKFKQHSKNKRKSKKKWKMKKKKSTPTPTINQLSNFPTPSSQIFGSDPVVLHFIFYQVIYFFNHYLHFKNFFFLSACVRLTFSMILFFFSLSNLVNLESEKLNQQAYDAQQRLFDMMDQHKSRWIINLLLIIFIQVWSKSSDHQWK